MTQLSDWSDRRNGLLYVYCNRPIDDCNRPLCEKIMTREHLFHIICEVQIRSNAWIVSFMTHMSLKVLPKA